MAEGGDRREEGRRRRREGEGEEEGEEREGKETRTRQLESEAQAADGSATASSHRSPDTHILSCSPFDDECRVRASLKRERERERGRSVIALSTLLHYCGSGASPSLFLCSQPTLTIEHTLQPLTLSLSLSSSCTLPLYAAADAAVMHQLPRLS